MQRRNRLPEKAHVEGVDEAVSAFKDFGESAKNKSTYAEAGAEALIPTVAMFSRHDTGALAAGWGVEQVDEGAAFINDTDYWTYQEFGTQDIDPTDAIGQAWQRREEAVVAAYDAAMKETAEENGFKQ